ncbi:MAG: hypothetical protein AB7O62_16585, partial [Pirellulales bacterium]
MSPPAPDPAVSGQTPSTAGRRATRHLRPPDAVSPSNRRVIVHLPDLTPISAKTTEQQPKTDLPKSLPATNEGVRVDVAASSGPAAVSQSPHFTRATASASNSTSQPKPYTLAALKSGNAWRSADWKSKLAALQPTIMLALVGITAGVLIGWLWTGGRGNVPPMEPAPKWEPAAPDAQILQPENGGEALPEQVWENEPVPSMPAVPPAPNGTEVDPYGEPPAVELRMPDSAYS